jgi:hypothetical protein
MISIFSKSGQPETDPNSGREAIRRRLYALARKVNLGNTARDAAVPLALLDDFANSRGELSPEQLDKLARELCNASYNAESDRMHDLVPNIPQPGPTAKYLAGLRFDPNHPTNKKVMPRPDQIWAQGVGYPTPVDPPKVKPSGAIPKRKGFA